MSCHFSECLTSALFTSLCLAFVCEVLKHFATPLYNIALDQLGMTVAHNRTSWRWCDITTLRFQSSMKQLTNVQRYKGFSNCVVHG